MYDDAIEHFLDEGLIEQVIRPIKSGKEASVHLCRANPRTTGEELAALKIYHPLDRRDFRDESLYRDGEFIKERRIRVAIDKRTRYGRRTLSCSSADRARISRQRYGARGSDPRPSRSLGGNRAAAMMRRNCDENSRFDMCHGGRGGAGLRAGGGSAEDQAAPGPPFVP